MGRRTTCSGSGPSNWKRCRVDRYLEPGATPRADTLTEATFLPPLEFVTARGRAAKWFEFDYVWEVYKPAAKRRWGYYVMPILHGDRLVGRADLRIDRAARTLIVPHLWLERSASARDADLMQAIRPRVAPVGGMGRWRLRAYRRHLSRPAPGATRLSDPRSTRTSLVQQGGKPTGACNKERRSRRA